MADLDASALGALWPHVSHLDVLQQQFEVADSYVTHVPGVVVHDQRVPEQRTALDQVDPDHVLGNVVPFVRPERRHKAWLVNAPATVFDGMSHDDRARFAFGKLTQLVEQLAGLGGDGRRVGVGIRFEEELPKLQLAEATLGVELDGACTSLGAFKLGALNIGGQRRKYTLRFFDGEDVLDTLDGNLDHVGHGRSFQSSVDYFIIS